METGSRSEFTKAEGIAGVVIGLVLATEGTEAKRLITKLEPIL